ncbi:hypothetical protein [Bradyrhizobium sp.]|uniref:hypothetical protein n=1 Tax=Bradyrhizobium sp. TaxID=376 RepID=UPI003C5DD83C
MLALLDDFIFGRSRNGPRRPEIRANPDRAARDSFSEFQNFFDGRMETGVLRFRPAPSEGRFAIVTDVGGGDRAEASHAFFAARWVASLAPQ